MLAGFFAVQVLAPGLYLTPEAYLARDTLTDEADRRARLHGRALVALAAAVRASEELQALRPEI